MWFNHSMYSIKEFVRNLYNKYLKELFAKVVYIHVCVCVKRRREEKLTRLIDPIKHYAEDKDQHIS